MTLRLAPLLLVLLTLAACNKPETPAVARIPGFEEMIEISRRRNPRGRLTTPEDVAGVLVALSERGCGWVTGNVIQVDGGESIVA
jgi:NAD(P)-dependent dehydrogenase (short-subunit alcohol dehydrogenase family)